MSSPAFERQNPTSLWASMHPDTRAKEANFQQAKRAMRDRLDEAETRRRDATTREGEKIRLRLLGQQVLFEAEELIIPETPVIEE